MVKQTRGLVSAARWLLPATAALMVGCPNEELAPIEPCTVSGVTEKITTTGSDEVDLLFMIDNSGSMKDEQENLANNLPALVRILTSGELPLDNGDTRTFTPVASLHLGVISSDMGINGVEGVMGCGGLGNDGLLLTECAAGNPTTAVGNHLEFTVGDDVDTLGDEFACITTLGTGGCGLEQQLEAVWKALAPSSNVSFTSGTAGHGDAENRGFLRENSVIAVVVVTDEEDCSIPDTARAIFDSRTDDPKYASDKLNSRCAIHTEDLHDVSRYVDGLKSLRPDNPDLVIFAAIAGIPIAAEMMVDADGVQQFDEILELEKMQIQFTDEEAAMSPAGALPDPACETGEAKASPARRFVQTAKGFGANGIVRSICQSSFAGALNAIIDKIANKLTGACLPRVLNPGDQGLVECDIVEYMPVGVTECNAAKGRELVADNPIRKDDAGNDRTVCKINQVVVNKQKAGCVVGTQDPANCLEPNMTETAVAGAGMKGWYYDDFTEEVLTTCTTDPQRIAFTPGDEQERGSEVRFECLQPVFTITANPAGKETVNKPCDGTPYEGLSPTELAEASNQTNDCVGDDRYPTIRCEPKSATCQIMCQADANCPDSWVCDKVAGDAVGFCVNPTCPN